MTQARANTIFSHIPRSQRSIPLVEIYKNGGDLETQNWYFRPEEGY